jgi:predicted XRE-type DNA-binding protein
MTKKSNFIASSGNVFADIGCEDAPELLAKAKLAHEIASIIKARGLTQQAAANLLATTQAKVSDVVRGRLEKFTLDRLIKMLVAFDRDVDISYKPASHGHAVVTVHPM